MLLLDTDWTAVGVMLGGVITALSGMAVAIITALNAGRKADVTNLKLDEAAVRREELAPKTVAKGPRTGATRE